MCHSCFKNCFKRTLLFPAVVVVLWSIPEPAAGEDKDLTLRLPAALSRFSSFPDVAGVGGASAASQWSSSVNPASTAWVKIPTEWRLSPNIGYSNIGFSRDLNLHVVTESLLWDAGPWGAFQPGLAQVRSNIATTRQGLDFGLNLDSYQLKWGKRISDDATLGAALNFATSDTRFDYGQLHVSRSEGESYDFRFGGLYRPANRWLVGMVVDYGFSPSRTTMYDLTGLGLGNRHLSDTTNQFLVRPGISYEYMEKSTLYIDYESSCFLNDTGRLTENRILAGMDHRIAEGVYLRAGLAADTKGNVAWTTGMGVCPTKWLFIDFAYQDDMFPEIHREFGRSRLLTVSIGIVF